MDSGYSGFRNCERLKQNQKCIKLLLYGKQGYEEVLHEHLPRHRLSYDDGLSLMRAIVSREMKVDYATLILAYLNKRRGGPKKESVFVTNVDYPEPGVLRLSCRCRDSLMWIDEVIDGDKFLRSRPEPRA
jgi:hypothetical protein